MAHPSRWNKMNPEHVQPIMSLKIDVSVPRDGCITAGGGCHENDTAQQVPAEGTWWNASESSSWNATRWNDADRGSWVEASRDGAWSNWKGVNWQSDRCEDAEHERSSPSATRKSENIGMAYDETVLACKLDRNSGSELQVRLFFQDCEGFQSLSSGAPGKNCFVVFSKAEYAEKAIALAAAFGIKTELARGYDRARSRSIAPALQPQMDSLNAISCGSVPHAPSTAQNNTPCSPDEVLLDSVLHDHSTQMVHPSLLQTYHDQKTQYGNYLACWNVACRENPTWLVLRECKEGYICPWCILCKAYAETHLNTPKCRDKAKSCGLRPGPFLQGLLDNNFRLTQLTQEQLDLEPTIILSDDAERSEFHADHACPSLSSLHFSSQTSPTYQANMHTEPAATVSSAAVNAFNQMFHGTAQEKTHPEPVAELSAITVDRFTADPSRHFRCANPKCSFMIHTDSRFGGFCCKNCSDWHKKGCKRTLHGKLCQQVLALPSVPQAPLVFAESLQVGASIASASIAAAPIDRGASELPLLPPGSWRAARSTTLQEGLDLDTQERGCIREHEISKEISSPVLIQDSDLLALRCPLENGGWVTLSEKCVRTGRIRSSFHEPGTGWEECYAEESFDAVWAKVKHCHDEFEKCQALVRQAIDALVSDSVSCENGLLAGYVANRDRARAKAFHHVSDFLDRPSVKRCRMEDWSGGGLREQYVDTANGWYFKLERASEIDFESDLKRLGELRQEMRVARVAVKKIDHALDIAPDEDRSEEEINELKEEQILKGRILRSCIHNHRKKMIELIGVVDQHFPERRLEIMDVEKEFLRFNIERDSDVWKVFDFDRELGFYRAPKIICAGRHQVYEAEDFDGKPCVLKRINWQTNQGSKAFIKEVNNLAKLRHPLVVSIECAFMDFKHHFGYLQFERLECNLEEWMKKQHPDDITNVGPVIYTLIQAIVWIHSQDVVHCDIKPSNFMWDSRRSMPRLHDFETAREQSASTANCNTTTCVPHTPGFEAPEMLRDLQNCPRTKETDVFALGKTIDEVLKHMVRRQKSTEKNQLRVLVSKMTEYEASKRITAVAAEDECRDVLYHPGHVEVELVKCSDLRYTQHSISPKFADGRSFDSLINSIMEDPAYPLHCDTLTLEVVKIKNWLHSTDNRRLYCFKEAQKWLPNEDLWIRIRKYTFGPQFDRLMGRYNTRTDGKEIRVSSGISFYNVR